MIERYPEAADALATEGILWDVDDPKLSVAIQIKYERLVTENTSLRAEALTDWLQTEGFSVETTDGMPVIYATLPKQAILTLEKRDDVARIFAADSKITPASDIGVQTSRAPVVWNRGYNGNGVNLAILETGNIGGNAANCMSIVATRTAGSQTGHKNRVAAVAACNNGSLPGMASGASVVDAGHNGSASDAVEALKWATNTSSSTRSNIVNESEQVESDSDLHLLDHAYDYWIRLRNFTAVIAAGNDTDNVTTPAVAYNVIAVGNVDDSNTSTWADDAIYSTSNYIDPSTGTDKPEVAAPGSFINTVDGEQTGTSFAAPQVAGLSAILIQRNSNLSIRPTAVKAIIMASAVHNVEGDSANSDKDGAGSIDVALADWIAQTRGTTGVCTQPCWWDIATTNSTPAVSGYVDRTFQATEGEHIRVAIAWFSEADTPTESSADALKRNFDLQIFNPDNTTTAASATSSVNNFEVVEFTASQTGQFKIRVHRNAGGDGGNETSTNMLGIAWVKDATYLPDVRNNTNVSTIYVRNNDVNQRTVQITYLNPNGSHKNNLYYNIARNALIAATSPTNWQGSAIVDGGESIIAVVRNSASGIATFDNAFTSLYNNSDYAFEQAATILYAPAIYNNIFSGLNSLIYLQNTSSSSNPVTVTFYGRAGYGNNSAGLTLSGGGSGVISTSVFGSNPWVGSAKISASQPIAVKIYESQGGGTTRSFNASAAGRSLMYVPAAYRTYGATNFNSGLVIQNLSGGNTNVAITYCQRDFTGCVIATPKAVGALQAFGINVLTEPLLTRTPNWTGSVKIVSTPVAPLAAAVTNSNNVGGYDFNANNIANLRYRVITLPYVAKAAGPTGNERTTGYTIRNINGSPITVRIKYYNTNGTLKDDSRFTSPVNFITGEVKGYHQGSDSFLSNGWEGSVVLESSGDIIAMMREDTSTTTAGYNGIPR